MIILAAGLFDGLEEQGSDLIVPERRKRLAGMT